MLEGIYNYIFLTATPFFSNYHLFFLFHMLFHLYSISIMMYFICNVGSGVIMAWGGGGGGWGPLM